MPSPVRPPALPTLPRGEQIASYDTYLEAQRAVDHLSDKAFPVQHVTIVGTDLRMVERITGRLTYSRIAFGGLASGAWFGLLFGLLLSMFSQAGTLQPITLGVALGAGFGILFSLAAYALTGRRRDFTSSSQIVASSYALLCAAEVSGQARQLLLADGGPGVGRGGLRTPAPVGPGAGFGPQHAPQVPPTQPGQQAPVGRPGPATPPTQGPVPPTQGPVPPEQGPTPPTQPPAGPQS